MGFLRWLANRSSREILKLKIYMRYSLDSGRGAARVEWILLDRSLRDDFDGFRCGLVSLLYARILTIHHADRRELFERVGHATAAFLAPGNSMPLHFQAWILRIDPLFGSEFFVWPWRELDSGDFGGADTYTATLRLERPWRLAPNGLSLDLEMHFGNERIEAPGCVLIAISELFRDLKDPSTQRRFAQILNGINLYYGSAEHAALMSEGAALAAATRGVLLDTP